MSLYTIGKAAQMQSIGLDLRLTIEECTDTSLLSWIGTTTLSEVTRRLANDNLAFVAYWEGQPAAFGWMARGKVRIGELNHEFVLPDRHRYLWNFRTLQDYRGKGIYPALLQFILKFEESKTDRFWILHAPENQASQHGIVKAGFVYVGTLYLNEEGITRIENTPKAKSYKAYLQYMDIEFSPEAPNSCWNCSSPYVKNKKPECCCGAVEKQCVGTKLLVAS